MKTVDRFSLLLKQKLCCLTGKKYHLHRHNLLKDAELNPLYSAQAAYSNHGYVVHSWNSRVFLQLHQRQPEISLHVVIYTCVMRQKTMVLLYWLNVDVCILTFLTSSVFGSLTNSKGNWTQRYARHANCGRLASRA